MFVYFSFFLFPTTYLTILFRWPESLKHRNLITYLSNIYIILIINVFSSCISYYIWNTSNSKHEADFAQDN